MVVEGGWSAFTVPLPTAPIKGLGPRTFGEHELSFVIGVVHFAHLVNIFVGSDCRFSSLPTK